MQTNEIKCSTEKSEPLKKEKYEAPKLVDYGDLTSTTHGNPGGGVDGIGGPGGS